MNSGGKASERIKLSYAVLLVLAAISWFANATDERHPQPSCWKRRAWGLRLDDEEQSSSERCVTAFIPTPRYYMDRIPMPSKLRVAEAEQDSKNSIDIELDEEVPDTTSSSLKPKSKSEWIDGRTMMQLMEIEKAKEEQERQRQREMELFNNRFQPPIQSQGNSRERRVKDRSTFSSRITYTDANTLQIELPPSGVSADVFFSGAFSALWFSAVAPATVGMISSGGVAALFMVPFWLAGGMIAKTAVVDPFVSSKLTIGDYLWTLEKNYFQSRGKLTSKTEDGPTETFRGASVEVGMLVNNVPRYELRLFFDGDTVSFGKGLSYDELEYLAEKINEHCADIGEIPKLEE